MKKEDFIHAMGEIDQAMIDETDRQRGKKKRGWIWKTALAAAACAALVLGAVTLLDRPGPEQKPASEVSLQERLDAILEKLEEEKPKEPEAPEAPEAPSEPAEAPPAETKEPMQETVVLDSFPEEASARLQLLEFEQADMPVAEPSVPAYKAEEGLTNVVNLDQFYLSEEEMELLEENLFLVMPSYNSEFFETYEYNRYAQIPNYVTVDSMMHTFHLYFSLLLNRTEKNELAGQLQALSNAMLATAISQYEELKGTQWEEAAARNVAFFNIAAALQNDSTDIHPCGADMVQYELRQIYNADGIAESAVTGAFMDYSQFKPRGYYEGDEVLERYFRAMMWYGQVNFAQSEDTLNRSALLMTLAMAQTDLTAWERIYTVTACFAGVSDDLTYYEYAPVIEQAYGGYPSASDLIGNEAAYETFVELTAEMPTPAINSVPVYQTQEGDLGEMNKGFRFMGQRFTVDAAIMQRLVYRAVEGENSEGLKRLLPDTLDVAAALGSDTALALLEAQGETEYGGYLENMDELRIMLESAPEQSWTTSLYSSWLYTLMPLLEEKGEGYPSYMTSEEWSKKALETFAGSFTELKHDTVLYAKQVMAEMGGGPPEVLDDRGYVEPEPEVYARFMMLAQQTAEGLSEFGILSAADLENLSWLEELARRLMVIANKELENEALTDEEYELICGYGGTLEHLWVEAVKERTDAAYLDPQEIPASLVTDVATDPNGWVLQIANAKPAEILVIVPVDGTLRLASGVVYNFYQFTQPIHDRLTDTQWRQKIGEWEVEGGGYHTDETLTKPWWTESYWCE